MTLNDIFRRIRYIFDFRDPKMIEIFALADYKADLSRINDWLKREDEPGFREMKDVELSLFLNGLINLNRGKKEGPQDPPELRMNNNIIFRKLKIALNLKDTDILEILALAGMQISKHELSSFFRNPNQRQYAPLQDQILRNFMQGMQIRYRKN